MLQTVVFDMGNVLLNFSHEKMCRQIAAVCGRSPEEIRQWLFDDNWELDFERGDITEDQFHSRLQDRADCVLERAALKHAASDIFWLNEPMLPIVDKLKAMGVRLVLMSNTHVWHVEHARRAYDFLDRFDEMVLSYAVGAVKPEAAIFDAVVKTIDCHPSQAFYTDDIAKYVEAGRKYGLDAEVFTDAATLRQHLDQRGIRIE